MAGANDATGRQAAIGAAAKRVGDAAKQVLAWLRRHTTLESAALAASVVSIALPLTIVRNVPFVDYPEHIAQVATLSHYFDPRFHPYYKLAFAQSQYFGFYFPSAVFATLLGTEIGTRLFLIISFASLPVSLATYLVVHKRDPVPAMANACVAFTLCSFWGFMNFQVGVSVAILALAAQAALIQKPNWKRAALFAAAAVAVFYCHTYVYVWFVAACAVQMLVMSIRAGWRVSLQAAWRCVAAGIPSGLAALYWLHASRFLERGEIGDRIGTVSRVQYYDLKFATLSESLDQWLDNSFNVYIDGAGKSIAITFLCVVGALLLLRIALWSIGPRSLRDITVGAPEALVVFSLALYLVGPRWFKNVDIINDRYIIISFALLPVLGPVRWGGTVKAGAAAILAIFCSWVSGVHIEHFMKVDQEMGDLDQALAHAAPGRRLLGLIYDTSSSVIRLPVFLHAHQYYQSRIGGMAAWSCVELAHSPILYRDGAAPPPFPARFEWTPGVFTWDRWGPSFDYFLVRSMRGRAVPNAFTFTTNGKVHVLFDGTRWKLYERTPQ